MTFDFSYFGFAHRLIISASLLQTLILVNSGISLLYCSMTALAHTTQNKTIQAIAHTVRITSLYVGGLIVTLIIAKHIYGSFAYSFDKFAIFGLLGVFVLWAQSIIMHKRIDSVKWILTLNLIVIFLIILIKAQSIALGRPWGPREVESAWLNYSAYYLITAWCALFFNLKPFDFNKKPFAFLRTCDRYIKHIDPKDGAIRSTCFLCFTMINFTGLIFTYENVNSFILLIVICQLIITLILAMRFSARCSDAGMSESDLSVPDGFLHQMYLNLEASLAVARKQKKQGILPPFNAWLFCIALLSSFNTISPAYCSGHDDEAVASPVSEGAQVSRGASKAGEAIYRSAQQASEAFKGASRTVKTEEVTNLINTGSTAGIALYGIYQDQGQAQVDQMTEIMNQAGDKMTESMNQAGDKVDRLSGEIERLTETTVNAQAQENAQLKAELDAHRSQNKQLSSEHKQLSSQNKQLSSQNKQLSSEHKQLSSQNKQLSSQNKQLSSEHKQLSSENNELKAKLESASAQLEKLKTEKPKSFFSWFCSSKPRTSE